MPEGDTYTRIAAHAREVLDGETIRRAAGVPDIRRHSDRVVGHSVAGIRTQGKHLLFDLTSGWTIHVWLGMPGHVSVVGATQRTHVGDRQSGAQPDPRPGGVRLQLETDRGSVTVMAAPTVEIERRRVIDADLASLGPDVLDVEFRWAEYGERVRRVNPDRPVAEVIIDQRVLAGIGNVYKSEILFLERLHPSTPWGRLSPEQVERLATRAIRLMTPNRTRARRVTTGTAVPGRESWVYGRDGAPCRRCRSAIAAAEMGEPPRITYWCPVCQSPEASDR